MIKNYHSFVLDTTFCETEDQKSPYLSSVISASW